MFCQPRFSRKLQIWHYFLIQAFRLSLISWVLPEIPNNFFFPLPILSQGGAAEAAHWHGGIWWNRDHAGAWDTILLPFHQAPEVLCPCRRTHVKRHCWAQLLALLPGSISVTKAEYPKCPASVNCCPASKRLLAANPGNEWLCWLLLLPHIPLPGCTPAAPLKQRARLPCTHRPEQ